MHSRIYTGSYMNRLPYQIEGINKTKINATDTTNANFGGKLIEELQLYTKKLDDTMKNHSMNATL